MRQDMRILSGTWSYAVSRLLNFMLRLLRNTAINLDNSIFPKERVFNPPGNSVPADTDPLCKVVACPDLAVVNFTTITNQTGTKDQDTITYACITGYELTSGSLTRQCMYDKTWSGSIPVCEVVACPPLAVVNFTTTTAQTGTNYQDTITYACIAGYELTSGSLTRQCMADQTWVEVFQSATGTNYQDTITYACITGYELTSGSLTLQCMANQTWSGSLPVCEVSACPDLAAVNFTSITIQTGTNYQDTITYACITGYELTSEIVACRGLAEVKFARITAQTGTNYQDTITYACIKGYKPTYGSRLTRTCKADGTWNNHPPFCRKMSESFLGAASVQQHWYRSNRYHSMKEARGLSHSSGILYYQLSILGNFKCPVNGSLQESSSSGFTPLFKNTF
ncbi:CSMD [Mytilus coruscus]|uniref:CSMD n=1 Tax=Mytilus coruscus TaxID=42192 RepID=A0A6J8BDX6_MYTCO|nr:CSMD [Mytilus coruscus]